MKITKREYSLVLGCQTKFINEKEMEFRRIFRKGLFVGRNVKKGELIAREDIIALRPRGDAPKSEDFMLWVDKVAEQDIKQYESIK